MSSHFLIEAPVALVPVLAFLGVLLYFDSYRLISLRELAETIGIGLVLAGAAYYVNGYLLSASGVDYQAYSRFGGPVVEETLKASALIFLFARNRIGFMIDAAIMGFAVGTGF